MTGAAGPPPATGTLAVALFRNLNLGHRGSPNRAALEAAFTDAGATDVFSFQTNGTVAHRSLDPDAVLRAASASLAADGYTNTTAFGIDAARLLAVLDGLPPEGLPDGAYREVLTFFDPALTAGPQEDGPRIRWLSGGPGWVHSIVWFVDGTAGSPGPVLEKQLRTLTTMRTRGTMDRLAVRLRRLQP